MLVEMSEVSEHMIYNNDDEQKIRPLMVTPF